MLEIPEDTVKRICQKKGASSDSMFAMLLELLRTSHIMQQLEHRPTPSLLAEIETVVRDRHEKLLPVLKDAEEQGATADVEQLQKKVRTSETLWLVIREMMNQTEHGMITTELEIEDHERKRSEGDEPV